MSRESARTPDPQRAPFVVLERVLFSLLTLLMALPVLVVSRPPLQHMPLYVTTFTLLREGERAGGAFVHDVLGSHGPIVFFVGTALSTLFDPGLVYRVLMALSVASFPWALRALCAALGRGRALSWLGAPVVYSHAYVLGDLHLVSALSLALWTLASALRMTTQRSLLRELVVVCGLVITSLVHVAVAAPLFVLVIAITCVGGLHGLTRRIRTPIVALLLVASFMTFRAPRWVEPFLNDVHVVTPIELGEHLRYLGRFVFETFREKHQERLLTAWVFFVCLSVVLALLGVERDESPRARHLRSVVLFASGACALLFLILPTEFDQAFHWASALSGLSVIFLLACLPLPSSWVRGVLVVAFGAVAFSRATEQLATFQAFDLREIDDFDAALVHVPQDKRVLHVISWADSAYVHSAPFAHYAAYYLLRSEGGRVAPVINDLPGWPLLLRDDRDRPPVADVTLGALGYVYPATLAWTDYVLVRGAWSTRSVDQTEVVYAGSGWSLYRVLRERKRESR